MSSTTLNSQIRPVATEAAAAAVATAVHRLLRSLAILYAAYAGSRSAAAQTLARRRDAQKVLDLARRFDRSQPGVASDLRAAAYRAMD